MCERKPGGGMVLGFCPAACTPGQEAANPRTPPTTCLHSPGARRHRLPPPPPPTHTCRPAGRASHHGSLQPSRHPNMPSTGPDLLPAPYP